MNGGKISGSWFRDHSAEKIDDANPIVDHHSPKSSTTTIPMASIPLVRHMRAPMLWLRRSRISFISSFSSGSLLIHGALYRWSISIPWPHWPGLSRSTGSPPGSWSRLWLMTLVSWLLKSRHGLLSTSICFSLSGHIVAHRLTLLSTSTLEILHQQFTHFRNLRLTSLFFQDFNQSSHSSFVWQPVCWPTYEYPPGGSSKFASNPWPTQVSFLSNHRLLISQACFSELF